MPVISVKNLCVDYGAMSALEKVSFQVERGDYVGIVGPNGAGKSTLARALLNLSPKKSGTIEIFGQPVESFSKWHKIGYLPQKTNLFNPLFPATVLETVKTGLLSKKRFPKKMTSADEKAALKALEELDISNLAERPINGLSGGQQQRVFLARALAVEPEILIMDEPSSALDPQTREKFFSVLMKLNKEKHTTVMLITHDSLQIGHFAQKLLYLDRILVYYGLFKDFCLSANMEERFGHYIHHIICHQHHDK